MLFFSEDRLTGIELTENAGVPKATGFWSCRKNVFLGQKVTTINFAAATESVTTGYIHINELLICVWEPSAVI
jgi:hypothetical protein